MQTGSSGTLIGWKTGRTTPLMSLYETEWRDRGYGLRAHRDKDDIQLLLEGKVVLNWFGWNLPPNATH
jgi:hypothetical protein